MSLLWSTIAGLPPIDVGEDVSRDLVDTVWVTAVGNGQSHMDGSKHYASEDTGFRVQAADMDTVDAEANLVLTQRLREALPEEIFDIVLHQGEEGESGHVHVEIDVSDPLAYRPQA